MDLRVRSTGKEFRRIDNGVALLIEEMFPEAVERINPAPHRPVVANAESSGIANHALPVWSIFTAPISGHVYIKCAYQRGESFYNGPPENAAAFKVGTAHMSTRRRF